MSAPLLPTLTNARATVHVLEAIGYGPDREAVTTSVVLGDRDAASGQSVPIRPRADGSQATSCERWLRILFEPPFTRISRLRFWSPDLAPNAGWFVLWGASDAYRKPGRQRSEIAYAPLPTSDGGLAMLDLHQIGAGQVSNWLVLQAVAGSAVDLQAATPHLEFAWTEV